MRKLRVDNYEIDAPLIDVIRRLQLTLTNGKLRDVREGGDNIVVTCPNDEHSGGRESKPACNVYVGNDPNIEYGMARCFVCGFTSSFVGFVAECFGYSEKFAKDWLIKNFGVSVGERLSLGEDISIGKSKKPRFLDESRLDGMQSWCPYLGERKLTRETCEKFGVKYDDRHRQVLFPCRDAKGRLVMVAKRSIDTKTFYLDKDREKPVYLLDYVIKNGYERAIVTEGPFDALTGNQYGAPTIATFGTPSDEQIEQIGNSCIKFLYTMFDNDDAGRRFADAVKSKVSQRILVTNVRIPYPYKDINDLDRDAFWEAIEKAENA